MELNHVGLALGLTLLAGLSTGIGSLIAFFARQTNKAFLSLVLGFSAGVMIYVSMVELFPEGRQTGFEILGNRGLWLVTGAYFAGMLTIALIDSLVPSYENPHEPHLVEEMSSPESAHHMHSHAPASYNKLLRTGSLAALAVGIHNFPEGLATFVAVLHDPSVGIAIAIAIAIHNIPEGISISIPIYYATGDRKKAFIWSFLSGLAEPIGALLGYLILLPYISEMLFASLSAFIAGIMVFVSLDELLPAAREYGEAHQAVYGLIAGMLVMALSLLLMN